MLRFAVFDESGPAGSFPLRHAYLVGADDVPIPGQVRFADGMIECEKRGEETAALSLLFDAGDCGRLVLRTCLLPDRERPYLLSLELARHRIMLFLTKLEDWFQCDLPPEEPAMRLFDEARSAFTSALAAQGAGSEFTAEEAVRAREALCLAIRAGERMTGLAAEIQITHRMAVAHAATAPGEEVNLTIGCAVRRDQMAEGLQNVIASHFDFMTTPMRWPALEPDEGEYSFAKTDRWLEWAVREAKMPVTAGPLIDLRPGRAPHWLYLWENDYDTLREVVFEHLKKVVTRYRKAVNRWTVASGLHLNAGFSLTLEQIMDLTRVSVMVVRKMLPNARIQLEIDQPFGEHYSAQPGSLPPLLYAEMVTQQGISVDAIGLRLQMGDAREGRGTRDLLQLAALLDSYCVFEKPLVVTALGAPSQPTPYVGPPTDSDYEPGHWRRPWSQEAQAEWMTSALTLALSKPFVHSVCWQELYDPPGGVEDAEMPYGGLITQQGKPKAALRRLAEIRRAMRDRVPPTRLPAVVEAVN